MQYSLKKAIIDYIFENINDFQLVNNTKNKFRDYIFDSKGEYLMGGEQVENFIKKAVE